VSDETSVDFFIHEKIVQAVYEGLKKFIVVWGGRGSSKSMGFGAITIMRAIRNPDARILCVRGTQNKISESSLQVLKDIIADLGYESYFNITEHTLSCKNGATFLFYGAKNYMSFKSLQGVNFVWVDEATELSEKAWDVLIPTPRDDATRFLISFNPEKTTDWVYKGFIENERENAEVFKLNYPDNPYFPETLRQEMEHDKKTNYQKYLHIWEGELMSEVDGALWSHDIIKYSAKDDELVYDRVVVAIDPATTSNAKSDACGLIVAGKVRNKDEYVVIEDLTRVASPSEWANLAISAYDRHGADRIVAETNQGGDMVKTIIKNIRKNVAYQGVHASRGKILRAEPVSALYEEGRVLHLKKFVDLEYEMVTYTGAKGETSPNRLDAMVYAIVSLSGRGGGLAGMAKVSSVNLR